MSSINLNNSAMLQLNAINGAMPTKQIYVIKATPQSDSTQFATKPPKIGVLRLALGMLNNDQINQVNKSGKLPSNAKIVYNKKTNSYDLTTNYFGITTGTSTLPAGYELRKNIWGFTVVVPTNSEGLYLRRKSTSQLATKPPKIGVLRLALGMLNNDQINQIKIKAENCLLTL